MARKKLRTRRPLAGARWRPRHYGRLMAEASEANRNARGARWIRIAAMAAAATVIAILTVGLALGL